MKSLIDQVVIRSAKPEDAEACYLVHRAAALEAFAHIFPPELYPFPDQQMQERWTRLTVEGNVLIAQLGTEVVATAGFDETDFISFFALPAYWGSGVAVALYEAVINQVKERGRETFYLWVAEENRRARRFYEKRGWLSTGETKQTPFPPNPTLVQYRIELKKHE